MAQNTPKPSTVLKRRLSELLKEALGQRAAVELLDEFPEVINQMSVGEPAPIVAELLVAKVVRLALSGKKTNQWAVDLIFNYTEGKPAAQLQTEAERPVEDKLDDVTRNHLNTLAGQFVAERKPDKSEPEQAEPDAGGTAGPEPEAAAAGSSASPLLDLPDHRPRRPKGS